MKLYEIASHLKELESMELTPDSLVALIDTIDSLSFDFAQKGRDVAAFFQNLDSDVAEMKQAEERIAARRRIKEKASERLKDYLRENMAACGITKIECPEFSITLGKASEVVEIEDISKIPVEFMVIKTTETPDKNAIKAAIKAGLLVDGVTLAEGKARLIIK